MSEKITPEVPPPTFEEAVDEKSVAPKQEVSAAEERRQSTAINLIKNPLQVRLQV